MALLSNRLYIDSNYKADCENKINYFNIFNMETEPSDYENNIIEGEPNNIFLASNAHLCCKIDNKYYPVIVIKSDGSSYYHKLLIEQNNK